MRRTSVDLTMPAGSPGFEEIGMTDLVAMEDVCERYLIRFRQMSAMVDDDNTVVNSPKL